MKKALLKFIDLCISLKESKTLKEYHERFVLTNSVHESLSLDKLTELVEKYGNTMNVLLHDASLTLKEIVHTISLMDEDEVIISKFMAMCNMIGSCITFSEYEAMYDVIESTLNDHEDLLSDHHDEIRETIAEAEKKLTFLKDD